MRIPGDSRSKGDRSVTVRCPCGADMFTLPAGQVLGMGPGTKPVSVQCKACGRPATLYVKPSAGSVEEPTTGAP